MIQKNSLNGKIVIVTGGCGFIGINLVNELINRKALVTVLDLPEADWGRLPKSVGHIKADIMDKDSIEGKLSKANIIYHLAAKTDLSGKTIEDYAVNYIGTKNLILEVSKSTSIKRFVFYSTQLVVGLFNETRFIDETEGYKTKTTYGESKIEGEKTTKEYCVKFSIPYTIIRPTSVYGPWGEAPYKAFFDTIKNKKYFHVGKASNLVSWVYVKNLVNLTITSSLNDLSKNETYFGNDFHPYTMREIVNEVGKYYKIEVPTVPDILVTIAAYSLGVLKSIGINVPLYPFRLKNIKANYCYDIKKSLLVGYWPEYDLHEGIKETLDWYELKLSISSKMEKNL